MTRLLVLLVFLTGCAIGHVHTGPGDQGAVESDVRCATIGHAKCRTYADGSVVMQGGAISNNMTEALGAFLTAAGAAFAIWSGGALP